MCVNDTCVLGFTHNDMVNVFKSIASGETVILEVCRGYPLPFDPNDPNTEVVTTIAVSAPDDNQDPGLVRNLQQIMPVTGDMMPDDPTLYMDLDPNLQNVERFGFLDSSFLPVHGHQNGENLTTASVNSMPDLCISDKISTIKRPNSTDILLSETGDFDRKNPSPTLSKPEFLSIAIVKGALGFGFTIADSSHGQKVKKILDRHRCKNLMEGDILVNINDVNVRNMCHSEVVQVLKDCPRNQEALIHVQRTIGKVKEKKDKNPQDFFRSKTPTADIYSTQSKTVVPSRPKTPLIDTRNRTKTPEFSRPDWRTENDNDMTLENPCKYPEYNHDMYYGDPYKSNVGKMTDNFGRMTAIDDDPMRHNREWRTNDKMNMNSEMYSVNPGEHEQMMKANGGTHSDYYKDLYSVRMHPQYQVQDYGVYGIGQEQSVDTGEIWDKRKETTSFEHEQPHSSSISR